MYVISENFTVQKGFPMITYLRLMLVELAHGYGYIFTTFSYFAGIVFLLNMHSRKIGDLLLQILESILLFCANLLLEGIIYLFTGTTGSHCGWIILLLMYAILFCKYRRAVKITMSVTYFSTVYLASSFAGFAAEFMRYYGLRAAGSRYAIDFTCFASVFITILVVLFLKKYSTEAFRFIPSSAMIMCISMSVIAASTQPVYHFIYPGFFDISGHYNALVSAILIFSNLLFYAMFYFAAKEYNENLTMAAIVQKAENDASILALNEKNLKEMHILRHELKNQFTYANSLLKQGEYEKLATFFEQFQQHLPPALHFSGCGNAAMDNILIYENSKAQDAGCRLTLNVRIPGKLPIPDVDLCSLFMNLFDNCIEASRNSDVESAEIKADIYMRRNYLIIHIANPVKIAGTPQEYLKLHTTKKDKQNHGYGTILIRNIVEKYAGSINFDIQNGQFITQAMLLLRQSEEL